MEVSRLQSLAIKVFKTLKSLNPDLMHTYFERCSHSATRAKKTRSKTTKFGEKSLRTFGPKIWNSLTEDVNDLTSLQKFTEIFKGWYGPECKCDICKYAGSPYHYT